MSTSPQLIITNKHDCGHGTEVKFVLFGKVLKIIKERLRGI